MVYASMPSAKIYYDLVLQPMCSGAVYLFLCASLFSWFQNQVLTADNATMRQNGNGLDKLSKLLL